MLMNTHLYIFQPVGQQRCVYKNCVVPKRQYGDPFNTRLFRLWSDMAELDNVHSQLKRCQYHLSWIPPSQLWNVMVKCKTEHIFYFWSVACDAVNVLVANRLSCQFTGPEEIHCGLTNRF